MHIYYVAGLPYSDELCHHGVKDQKWGVRRYQNEDGTLTPLGKIHYGAGNAARAVGQKTKVAAQTVGKGVKAVAAHRVQKFKDKHKWTMSDEELQKRIQRIDMEKKYKELLRDSAPQRRGKKLIGEILSSGAKTIGQAAFDKLIDNLLNQPDRDSLSYIVSETIKENFKNDWDKGKFTDAKDLKDAVEYVELLKRLEDKQGGGKKKK